MGSHSSPIPAAKARRRRLRFCWTRLRPLLGRLLLGICAFAAACHAYRSVQHVFYNPSVTEYLANQQHQKAINARRDDHSGNQSTGHGVTAALAGRHQSLHRTGNAGRQDAMLQGRGTSASTSSPSRNRGQTSSDLFVSSHWHIQSNKHKTQVLKRELRWTIFPLLSRVITDASEAMAGGDSRERGYDKEKERDRQEELLKKIEKWSNKPSSFCFGHGNLTIVTVTVDLPLEYVIHLRKNRLHYCALAHNCRYCDVSTNLDFSRPVAWTKVKAMQLALSFSDTVVHMDADALIVNASVSFFSLIASLSKAYNTTHKDVIYTTDFQLGRTSEPGPFSLINTGVYIMHSTDWAKAFLEVQDKLYHSSIFQKFLDQQAAVLYRQKHWEEFHEHIALIPYRYMNVPCSPKYNEYIPGDFIVHYGGGHNLEKYERLSKMFLEAHEL